MPNSFTGPCCDLSQGFRHLRKRWARPFDESPPGICQGNAARSADQQGHVQLLFQLADSLADGRARKELFIVKGAAHMDLYDGDGVNVAMTKLSPFFQRSLDRTM